jgi:hypothetical protein
LIVPFFRAMLASVKGRAGMRHKAKTPGWCAVGELAGAGISKPADSLLRSRSSLAWILGISTLLVLSLAGLSRASNPAPPVTPEIQRALESENWPAILESLRADPLTNSILRLAAVRALFETGRLPEEQFSFLHSPGPELLSTTDLKEHLGSVYVAETLLQLGHLNAAERLAFNSLEMEGEAPPVLRTLTRLHVVKGLTNAAQIFLNRLQAYPEHRDWTDAARAALVVNLPLAADPTIGRIRTNLVTREGIVTGLTTELVLRQALESNPENRMAFQFLVAHQLLARRLLNFRQTLAGSPQVRTGPLPRHYAEALLLHRQLYPGISLTLLLPRVPPTVITNFQNFQETMDRAAATKVPVQAQARRDFGSTYWYYYFFGAAQQSGDAANPEKP